MSRSTKYPIVKQKQQRCDKRRANKKVRKENIENYKGYSLLKKIFDPWSICDWRYFPKNKKEKIESLRK